MLAQNRKNLSKLRSNATAIFALTLQLYNNKIRFNNVSSFKIIRGSMPVGLRREAEDQEEIEKYVEVCLVY
jgi:hypothetical protein